ncbi:MAG: hypothetical protein M1830_010851 [Pleopsidium flavum]|nr:MAG: hypothetical protein M1830_010851 [Pleopsidium flavum]
MAELHSPQQVRRRPGGRQAEAETTGPECADVAEVSKAVRRAKIAPATSAGKTTGDSARQQAAEGRGAAIHF